MKVRLSFALLDTRVILAVLGIAVAVCALVQLSLGCNLSVLIFALISVGCGLYGFWLAGVGSLAGWFCLFYLAGSLLIAFYTKTILGQTLNSYLYAPFTSFEVEAICCFALLCALILASWIYVGRPLRPLTDLRTLPFLSWGCFVIGIAVTLFHNYADRQAGGPEYGGLNLFASLLYLGIIARTAYVILRSHGQKHMDAVLLFMLLSGMVVSGVFSTGRESTALPWVCFFVTVLFFKRKLPWRYVVLLVSGVVAFAAVAPVLLAIRSMGVRNLTLAGEVNAFEYVLPTLLNGDEFAYLREQHTRLKGYYNYFGNNQGQVIVGRFSSIQQSDPVIEATDATEPMGSDIIVSALRSNLPAFLDPNKPRESNAFVILLHEGFTSRAHGDRPSLPMAGELYAAFGMPGVIFGSFLMFLLYALALKKVGWNLYGNVFSIFILCTMILHVHGASISDFVANSLRNIPLLWLTVWGLTKVHTMLFMRRQAEI